MASTTPSNEPGRRGKDIPHECRSLTHRSKLPPSPIAIGVRGLASRSGHTEIVRPTSHVPRLASSVARDENKDFTFWVPSESESESEDDDV